MRDVESRSNAIEHYMIACQHAVEAGFGWLRVNKVRPPDDPLNVELRVESIDNRWSVMFDPFATEPDLRDARWCAVSTLVPREDFEARYGESLKHSPGYMGIAGGDGSNTVGGGASGGFGEWWSGADKDSVRVVEYWWKEPVRRTICVMRTPSGEEAHLWMDEISDVHDEMVDELGYEKLREVEVDSHVVKVVHCTDAHILEGPHTWGGFDIPIIGVFGRRVDFDGKRYYFGLTRYARDPQQMLNYWASQATERVGTSPQSKFMAPHQAIAGFETDWRDANSGSAKAILPYNFIEGWPGPQQIMPPPMPSGEMSLVSLGQGVLMDTIGLHEANLGQSGNEVSGKAIQARQMSGSISTREFTSNLAAAIARVGEIMCSLIPKLYGDENRLQRIVLADDSEAHVRLNQYVEDRESGKTFRVGALNMARYAVTVGVGPALMTQREALADNLTEWGKTNPQAATILLPTILRSSDFPMAKKAADMVTVAMLPPNLWSEELKAKYPPPPPTPDQEQQAQIEAAQAQAAAAQAESKSAVAAMNQTIHELKVEIESLKLKQQRTKGSQPAAQGGKPQGNPADIERMVKSMVADMMKS